MSNYSALGLKPTRPLDEGWQQAIIKRIEPSESKFNNDISVKITYEVDGRELSMFMHGKYRKENGAITGAGSAFAILDLFDALGIIGVKSDGTLNVEELNKFNSTPKSKPNVWVYMYRTQGNDGRVYIRVYKRIAPINASKRLLTNIEKSFRRDIQSGFVKVAPDFTQDVPVGDDEEVEDEAPF